MENLLLKTNEAIYSINNGLSGASGKISSRISEIVMAQEQQYKLLQFIALILTIKVIVDIANLMLNFKKVGGSNENKK